MVRTDRVSRYTISIHALLTESDLYLYGFADAIRISIHALLTESDRSHLPGRSHPQYFNPRSPHGERLTSTVCLPVFSIFQSTLSSRRATFCAAGELVAAQFQSTLSSRRATTSSAKPPPVLAQFQSTLSSRRATSAI